jgi:FMN phosphatase YigB (HAD superfamily)
MGALNVISVPYLKPDARAYIIAESEISNKHGNIYFVEDMFMNLAPVTKRPRWRSILLTSSQCVMHNSIRLVSNLAQVEALVLSDIA